MALVLCAALSALSSQTEDSDLGNKPWCFGNPVHVVLLLGDCLSFALSWSVWEKSLGTNPASAQTKNFCFGKSGIELPLQTAEMSPNVLFGSPVSLPYPFVFYSMSSMRMVEKKTFPLTAAMTATYYPNREWQDGCSSFDSVHDNTHRRLMHPCRLTFL